MHPRLCLILLAAGVRTTPQPPSGPDLANGASGCQELQAGNWVHANDAHYRYRAEDDGGTLTLAVSHVFDAGFSPRRFRVDAGAPRGLQPAADAGSGEPSQQVRIELQRTATGFEGATLAMVTMPSGQQCEARFPTTVVRLPGLFGPGLKKNIIFDFLHGNAVDQINAASAFQFYDTRRLWRDIEIVRAAGLPLVNFATEPTTVREVAREAFGIAFDGAGSGPPARYDFRTRHADLWGGGGGYLLSKRQVLDLMRDYVEREQAGPR